MRAYKGIVKEGKIELAEGVTLPEGAVVTVTLGEAELVRASLASVLLRRATKRVVPAPAYRGFVRRLSQRDLV